MQIHTLTNARKRKKTRRVGRGGKRGSYSGKGIKGQKARAGRKLRPELRDTIKRIPKLRGRRGGGLTSIAKKPVAVNLATINAKFSAGAIVSPQTLHEAGLIRKRGSVLPRVKILNTGAIQHKVKISGCLISEAAKAQVEKAGGEIVSLYGRKEGAAAAQ